MERVFASCFERGRCLLMRNRVVRNVALLLSLMLTSVTAVAETRVYLLAGQSQMAGLGGYDTPITSPYNVPQPNVKFWNYGPQPPANAVIEPVSGGWINNATAGDGWVDLQPGFGYTSTEFGPEVSFGYKIHSMFPGDNIYLIKYAISATNLAVQWNPNGTGPLYNTFKARVDAAMQNLVGQGLSPKIAGMLWLQGGSDAYVHDYAEAYKANLTNFITQVRSDFHTPDMRVVVGRELTVFGEPADNALVREAQMTVPAAVGNATWIDGDDLPQSAYVGHYGTQGQIELGQRFADAVVAPEPGTLGLLAAGLFAAGLFGLLTYAWRRREQWLVNGKWLPVFTR